MRKDEGLIKVVGSGPLAMSLLETHNRRWTVRRRFCNNTVITGEQTSDTEASLETLRLVSIHSGSNAGSCDQ